MDHRPSRLFAEFSSAASVAVGDLSTPLYLPAIKLLCEKSPDLARFLATEVWKHLQVNDEPQSEEELPAIDQSRKKRKVSDPTYRPQKSDRPANGIKQGVFKSSPAGAAAHVSDYPVTVNDINQLDGNSEHPCLDRGSVAGSDQWSFKDQPHADECGNELMYSPEASTSTLSSIKVDLEDPFTPLDDNTMGGESSSSSGLAWKGLRAVDASEDQDRPSENTSAYAFGTEQPVHGVLTSEWLGQVSGIPESPSLPMQLAGCAALPSTPEPQFGPDQEHSPPTEEVPRRDFGHLSDRLTLKSHLEEFVDEMSDTIAALSASSSEVPAKAHLAFINMLEIESPYMPKKIESANTGSPCAADPKSWSASMWVEYLKAGEARTQKSTIFNLVGYMGFSVWLEKQMEAFEPPLTKRGTARKRVATPFLNSLLMEAEHSTELVVRSAAENSPTSNLSRTPMNVTSHQRRQIIGKANKGRKLRDMVSKVGLGILLRRDIWSYQKLSGEDFQRRLDREFWLDARKGRLLPLLDEQVTILIKEGNTNLSLFLASLESSGIRRGIGIQWGCAGRDPHGLDSLLRALNQVLEGSDSHNLMVRDKIEVPLTSFDNLRPGRWLDMWLIAAAIELTDKPSWVRCGLSVPLHQLKEGECVPIEKPFGLWRKKIDSSRTEHMDDEKQVYLCPLNINNNHFTLLEINERTEMIYHYDSIAGMDVRLGKEETTPVQQLVEQAEFHDLGLTYQEAQEDSSSCGLMVIHNAMLRMTGREVESWELYKIASCSRKRALRRSGRVLPPSEHAYVIVPSMQTNSVVFDPYRRVY
ncbi:uncharacterized protein E0L32_007816 [Thyridium curvatum]|uniref:Ubiquitin-like protease family profile domain-containing protein n=1 Tax=Thyridium curvatum TaxID=1093900 RepID=A0A507AV78_9PEZI|nr:uncharacterized protein E0L32_007816 [Thyridium curvatum]TPX11397.1 hypothetical protein E0L32_007816 [Thyridium curvatum]